MFKLHKKLPLVPQNRHRGKQIRYQRDESDLSDKSDWIR